MFDFEKLLTECEMQVDAISFTATDMRTGEKKSGAFYYPRMDAKSLESLVPYGYRIDKIGETTWATGTVNLADLFGKFVNEGGLE